MFQTLEVIEEKKPIQKNNQTEVMMKMKEAQKQLQALRYENRAIESEIDYYRGRRTFYIPQSSYKKCDESNKDCDE